MSNETPTDEGRAAWHNEIVYQAVQLGVDYETANAWNTKAFGEYDWPKIQQAVLVKAREIAAEKIAKSVIDFIENGISPAKFEHTELNEDQNKAINRILDLGFWTEPIFEKDRERKYVWFRTVSPVVLWHDRTFVHRRIGYIAAKVDVDRYEATAFACGLNRFTAGRFHPHLWEGGRICYGSEATNATNARTKKDLVLLLQAIQNCICSYTLGYLAIDTIDKGTRQIQETPYGNRYDV